MKMQKEEFVCNKQLSINHDLGYNKIKNYINVNCFKTLVNICSELDIPMWENKVRKTQPLS